MKGTFTVTLTNRRDEQSDYDIFRGQNWYQVASLIRKKPGVLMDEFTEGAELTIKMERKEKVT